MDDAVAEYFVGRVGAESVVFVGEGVWSCVGVGVVEVGEIDAVVCCEIFDFHFREINGAEIDVGILNEVFEVDVQLDVGEVTWCSGFVMVCVEEREDLDNGVRGSVGVGAGVAFFPVFGCADGLVDVCGGGWVEDESADHGAVVEGGCFPGLFWDFGFGHFYDGFGALTP